MKKNWSKILFIASDVILAVYLLFAFTTVSKKSSATTVCSKVDIRIADEMTNGFLDAATVKHNLQKAGCYPVINKPLTDVNTRSIEEALMLRTPFVKTAECYKTEGGNVYITVTQRMPVIRIKAENGDDYYVDDNDRVMKSSSYTSDLIIATGNINRQYATRYLSPLGKVIMGNELWKNLIEQVNILPDRSVEIVPRVGDHVVCLGPLPAYKGKNGEKEIQEFMERKMGRLVKFYKYGLNNVGWNKYSYIDIQFDNQIICRKRDAALHAATPAPPVVTNEPAALSEGENTAAPATADSQTASEKKTDDKKEKADSNTRTNKANSNKTAKAESKKASKAEGKKTSDKESKNTSKKESKNTSKKENKKASKPESKKQKQ